MSPVISSSTHVIKQLFFFCVSTPTVLPLNVESIFLICPSILFWIFALLLVEKTIMFNCTTVYLSLCTCSPGSAPFTLHQFLEVIPIHKEFLQFITTFGTIVFHHHQMPQFIQPFPISMDIPSFSNFLLKSIYLFLLLFYNLEYFPMVT